MAIAPRAQRGGVSAPGQSAPTLPANFGQDQIPGRELLALAEPIMQHVQRVRTRQDTIEAARIRQQFSEYSQAELVRLSSEQDFSREETLNTYRANLMNRKRDLITNAPLSAEGRAKVDAELTNIMGVGIAEGAQLRVAEQNRIVAQSLSREVGAIVSDVGRDPSVPLPTRLLEVDALLSDRGYGPALTPEQRDALRTAATGQIVEAYMQPLVETADTEGLRNMLNNPVVRNALGTEQYRTLSSQLRVQELKKAQDAAARQATMDRLTAAGIDVNNPRVALALEGFNPSDIFPTQAADPEIRRIQSLIAMGMDPTEAVNRVIPLPSDGSRSTSLKAQDRDMMTFFGDQTLAAPPNMPPALSFKDVTDAVSLIEVAVRGTRNETTGVVTPGVVPVSALMALERAGVSLDMVRQDAKAAATQVALALGVPLPLSLDPNRRPGMAAPTMPMIGAPLPEPAPAPTASPEQTVTPAVLGPLVALGGGEEGNPQAVYKLMQPGLDFVGSSGEEATPPAPPFSLYGMAEVFANPIDRLMAIPGLLPTMSPDEKQRALFSAQANAKLSWNSLTEGLRTSPRFADAERQALEVLLKDIDPRKWVTNPGAYQADLEGVSEFLVRRYQHHQRILERDAQARKEGRSGEPAEQIRASRSMLNAMEWAINSIGYQDVDGNLIQHPKLVPEGAGSVLSPADAEELRFLEALEAQSRQGMGVGAP